MDTNKLTRDKAFKEINETQDYYVEELIINKKK